MKNWNWGTVQVHVEPPLIPLIKSKNNDKLDKYCVKIKLCRDLTSEKLDIYVFYMTFFDNGEPEELLLFIINFQITLEASWTITDDAKIQHIYTLVRGKVLHQLDIFSTEVGSTASENLKPIILGLGTYFFLLMRR